MANRTTFVPSCTFMVPRKPCPRRRVTLMRRASVSRLTDSADDAWLPRTAEAGPGMTRMIVVVPPVVVLTPVSPPCGPGGLGLGRGAGGAGGLRTGDVGSNSLPMTVHRSVDAVFPSGPVTVRL